MMARMAVALLTVLGAGASLWAAEPAAAGADKVWSFRVLLDGAEIGRHRFELRDFGDRRLLYSEADFEVDFLFITAFDYRHTAIERWHDGCLVALDATTIRNGERLAVSGKRQDAYFLVQKENGSERLPACVMTFAYWNPAFLRQSRLLDPQSGDWLEVETRNVGTEPLRVRGEQMTAMRHQLRAGQLTLDVWYSEDDEWLALESQIGGRRTLRYELI